MPEEGASNWILHARPLHLLPVVPSVAARGRERGPLPPGAAG